MYAHPQKNQRSFPAWKTLKVNCISPFVPFSKTTKNSRRALWDQTVTNLEQILEEMLDQNI